MRIRDYIMGFLWGAWFQWLFILIWYHFPTNNLHIPCQVVSLIILSVVEANTHDM
jgi:hypothetical protein